jgi:hypothetical protein
MARCDRGQAMIDLKALYEAGSKRERDFLFPAALS